MTIPEYLSYISDDSRRAKYSTGRQSMLRRALALCVTDTLQVGRNFSVELIGEIEDHFSVPTLHNKSSCASGGAEPVWVALWRHFLATLFSFQCSFTVFLLYGLDPIYRRLAEAHWRRLSPGRKAGSSDCTLRSSAIFQIGRAHV